MQSNSDKMHQKCSQNASKMQSKCRQNASKMQLKCSQNAVKMQSKCSQNAVKMQSKCSQNAVKMQSKCNQISVKIQSVLGSVYKLKSFQSCTHQLFQERESLSLVPAFIQYKNANWSFDSKLIYGIVFHLQFFVPKMRRTSTC